MITQKVFEERIKKLPKKIPSKTGGASYTNFEVKGDRLYFVRVNTGESWNLNIPVLYEIYKNNTFINTAVVKITTNRKVNSPSVAVLMAINCIDDKGNRLP